jgi:hypothetical protein
VCNFRNACGGAPQKIIVLDAKKLIKDLGHDVLVSWTVCISPRNLESLFQHLSGVSYQLRVCSTCRSCPFSGDICPISAVVRVGLACRSQGAR